MMSWYHGVVCLVVMVTGAHACCEPDEYAFNYDLEVFSSYEPGDIKARFAGKYQGTGSVDWPRGNIRLSFSGTYLDNPLRVKLGIIEGEKLLMQAESPLFGKDVCQVYKIKGGIPNNYQCATNDFREVSENRFVYASDNGFLRYDIQLTSDCEPERLYIPYHDPKGANFELLFQVKGLQRGVSAGPPDVPEDCEQLDQEIELPSSLGDKRKRYPVKRDIFNEGLKRLAREIGKW